MPDIDITEIDLFRIFKNPKFVIEHGGTPAPSSPSSVSTNVSSSVEGLKQLIAQGNMEITILKAIAQAMLPKTFVPKGRKGQTSTTPNTPQPLLPSSVKTSHFVFQNQGTATINIGDQDVQVISVAAGSMFFYSFTQQNYLIDLNSIYTSSASASQPYGILVFQ
jgi:hypothetical protein